MFDKPLSPRTPRTPNSPRSPREAGCLPPVRDAGSFKSMADERLERGDPMEVDRIEEPQEDVEECKSEDPSMQEAETSQLLCGLTNLGNTCYMNSVLQALTSCSGFSQVFLRGHFSVSAENANEGRSSKNKNKSPKGELAVAYSQLLKAMSISKDTKPSALKAVVGKRSSIFAGYEQHDSQEFLRFFLDGLHEDLNRIPGPIPYEEIKDIPGESTDATAERWWNHYERRNDSVVKDLFAGQLSSKVVCDTCKNESVAFDPIWDLSVPIPINNSGRPNLVDCLKKFTAEEQIEEYYCRKCKSHQPSKRVMQIYRAPEILVIHLKRFQQVGLRRSKLSTAVELPLEHNQLLDISQFTRPEETNTTYRLRAMVNHMGSLNGGHYVSNVRLRDSDVWCNFNDQFVSKVDPQKIDTSAAYVLFLERVDRTKMSGGGKSNL